MSPDQSTGLERLEPGRSIVGHERAALAVKIRAVYEKGSTAEAIAQVVGRSISFVQRLIVQAGGSMRSAATRRRQYAVPRAELAAELRRRYELGESSIKLATSEIGSDKHVRKLLREAGTVMRGPGMVTRHELERLRQGASAPVEPKTVASEAADEF